MNWKQRKNSRIFEFFHCFLFLSQKLFIKKSQYIVEVKTCCLNFNTHPSANFTMEAVLVQYFIESRALNLGYGSKYASLLSLYCVFYWPPALLALAYLILNEDQFNEILIGIFVASCIHSENAQFMGLQKGRRSKYSSQKKIPVSSCCFTMNGRDWMVDSGPEWQQ